MSWDSSTTIDRYGRDLLVCSRYLRVSRRRSGWANSRWGLLRPSTDLDQSAEHAPDRAEVALPALADDHPQDQQRRADQEEPEFLMQWGMAAEEREPVARLVLRVFLAVSTAAEGVADPMVAYGLGDVERAVSSLLQPQ